MERRIFFDDARKNVLEFFSIEFPSMLISQVDQFISLFYKLVNYEEEGQKIRPTVLITSNINSVVRAVPFTKKIIFYEDKDMSNFKARIKALMSFCRSDWSIYINFGDEIIEFGIISTLTSIKDKSLLQCLRDKATMESLNKKGCRLIVLHVLGGGVCQLFGAKGNKISVCFNLNSQSEYNWDNEIDEFVEACVSKIKTTQKKLNDIKTLITNIFYKALKDIHGTICMVVDKEFQDKTGFLADGTWLKEPIEFGKLFLRSSKIDENVLRAYADVLTNMLDFDGITIIDNAGRIRAYNVFIESNTEGNKVVGGARRRAAYTILQNKSKKIIGVYFQSQDGDNFYKEKSDLKKKKKIKIVDGEAVSESDDILPLEIIAKLQQQKRKEEENRLKEEQLKLEKAMALAEKEKKEKERLEKELAKNSTESPVNDSENKNSDITPLEETTETPIETHAQGENIAVADTHETDADGIDVESE